MTDATIVTPDKKNRKKLWTVVGVGALAAAVAGGGALSTLTTAIDGNRFAGAVPGEGPLDGAQLVISGQAIDHTFDTTSFHSGEYAQGTWTLVNNGGDAAAWDGTLAATGEVPASLAGALEVEFGDGSGGWHAAGTLAEQVSYATALGIAGNELAGESQVVIPVRLSLPDPSLLSGTEGELLEVLADFTVTYLNPLAS
jgi:hypothetical protein